MRKLNLQFFALPHSDGSDEPSVDLTGYTWVANGTLNITNTTILTYNVNGSWEFGNGGSSGTFTTLSYQLQGSKQIPALKLNNTNIYQANWQGPNPVSITFTSGTDATNSTLIAWLEANGTLTAPAPTPTGVNKLKIGGKTVIKKMIGNKEVLKQVVNGVVVYEKVSYEYTFSNGTLTITNAPYTLNNGVLTIGE